MIFLLVFLFGFFFTPILIKFSIKNNFYKNIQHRDIHLLKTPNIGGISIFLSFIFGFTLFCFFYYDFFLEKYYLNTFFIFSCFLIFLSGLIDDIFNISYILKFLLQFIIGILLVYFFNTKILSFYGLFGLYDFSPFFLSFFSVFVFVFIINSYNLTDGLDSLASLLGIFILTIFSIIFYFNNIFFESFIAFSVVISLLSFLYYNKTPSKIFMGDSGSLLIGFIISYLALNLCNLPLDNSGIVNPVLILCLLAYPSIDTLRVFFLRIINNKSPFIADRNHIHHIFFKRFSNHLLISIFIVIYTLILLLICYSIKDNITFSFFVMFFLAIFLIYIPIFLHNFLNKKKY